VFDEPWQAQALGLAFSLAERGVYSSAEWSQTLGAEHRRLLEGGAADTPQSYYEAVVKALERLLREKGPLSIDMLEDRVSNWRKAYQNTPHGQPVNLEAAHHGGAKNILLPD
jgi:nitrile hydratase accessory protein